MKLEHQRTSSHQNFSPQIYSTFHHYCILTPSRRLIKIRDHISPNCCISALEVLTGCPVSLGENACRKASLARVRDTWGHCHLECSVSKSKTGKENARK